MTDIDQLGDIIAQLGPAEGLRRLRDWTQVKNVLDGETVVAPKGSLAWRMGQSMSETRARLSGVPLARLLPEVEAVVEAAEESLLSGAHDGPCDNEDDTDAACSLHVRASEARREVLREALAALSKAQAEAGWPNRAEEPRGTKL